MFTWILFVSYPNHILEVIPTLFWKKPLRLFRNLSPPDRPVLVLWIVHSHFLRPSSFIPLNRLHSSLETIQINSFRSYSLFPLDCPLLDFRTVHIRRPSTLSLLDRPVLFMNHDRPVSVIRTVQFNPPGPSTLTWPARLAHQGRP